MDKKAVNIILIITSLILLSFNVNAARNSNERVEPPLQLKPERIKLLEKIANEKVIQEELPFTDETSDLMKKMLIDKDDFINNHPLEIKKLSRSLTIPMGVTDGEFETIYLSPNSITTLVFFDKLSQPWTLEKHSVSSPSKIFPEVVNSNMMTFSPKVRKGEGNMTLFFKDAFPINLNWVISEEQVDNITEIKLDGYGNNSPTDGGIRIHVGGNTVMPKFDTTTVSTMLSGNTPFGFKNKIVYNDFEEIENGFKVWLSDNNQDLYIRTVHKVLYPPVDSVKRSGDRRTKLYKTSNSPRLTVVKDGKLLNLRIDNK